MYFVGESNCSIFRPMCLNNRGSFEQLEDRRDVVIRCLLSFLGESAEELIEDYQVVQFN